MCRTASVYTRAGLDNVVVEEHQELVAEQVAVRRKTRGVPSPGESASISFPGALAARGR